MKLSFPCIVAAGTALALIVGCVLLVSFAYFIYFAMHHNHWDALTT